jgi:hypothetical protein
MGNRSGRTGNRLIAEISQKRLAAIEAQGQDYGWVAVEELKRPRQDADNFASFAVNHQTSADNGGIAAEFPLPESVREQCCGGA